MKCPRTEDFKEFTSVGRYHRGPVGAIPFEPHTSLEFWRCSATQTTLETWHRASLFLEWRSVVQSHI